MFSIFKISKSQRVHGPTLLVNPFLDLQVITIQQKQFPALEETRQEEQTSRNTKQRHERENNRNRRHVLYQKHQTKEENLENGIKVNLFRINVSVENSVGVQARLLEPKQETVPELHGRQGRKTHEQKHTVQDRHGKELQKLKNQQRQPNHCVGNKQSQSRFLHINDVAVLILVGKTVEMDNARNRGCHQPRKSETTIDKVEQTIQAKIVVVSLSVLQLVVLVVNQVPGDTVHKRQKQRVHIQA